MNSLCRTIRFYSLPLIFLTLTVGVVSAQPPFYRIGARNPPVRDPRLTTDNGIPGTGSYYYLDYPWPSLRQALQEYGLFGRRFNKWNVRAAKTPDGKSAGQRYRMSN